MSQLGWLFPIYGKIKNVPNHQSDETWWKMARWKEKMMVIDMVIHKNIWLSLESSGWILFNFADARSLEKSISCPGVVSLSSDVQLSMLEKHTNTHTHTQTAKSVTWSSAVRPTNKMTFLCFFWTSHSRCFQCFSFSSCFSWLAHIIEVIPSTGDHRKLGEMESKWLVCSACFKTKPTHCHSSQSPTSIDHQYHQNLPNWLVVSTHLNNSR